MVTNVAQRKIPLFIQIILCSSLLFKSFTLNTFPELFFFFLSNIISTAIALILTFAQKKISLHMLGITSLTVFCIYCSLKYGYKNTSFLSILIALNGLVASSRLSMKAHTKIELLLGFIIGALPQIIILPINYNM
jgi:membrane-associated phospholipid phosphatase